MCLGQFLGQLYKRIHKNPFQKKLYQDRNFTVIIDIPSGEKETNVVDVIAKKVLNCGTKYPNDKIIVLPTCVDTTKFKFAFCKIISILINNYR